MPNHVINKIRAESDKLDEIRKVLRTDDALVDFNALIPMPEIMKGENASPMIEDWARIAMGETKITGLLEPPKRDLVGSFNDGDYKTVAESLHIGNTTKLLVEGPFPKDFSDSDFERFIQYIRALKQTKHANWYTWCCANWGTKWNAYSISDEGDYLKFETAWSAPSPVFEVLAERVPGPWTVDFADEDIGSNCGTIFHEEDGSMEFKEPEDPTDFALTLWEYDKEEYYAEE